MLEAEGYDGPSLVIAYSHCIAHGNDLEHGLDQQKRAVASGYWPLNRFDPVVRAEGGNPFLLDSPRPRIPLADYTGRELRYRSPGEHRPGRGGAAARSRRARGRPTLGRVRGDGDPRPAALRRRRTQGAHDRTSRPPTWASSSEPLVASASPLSQTVDGVRRLADAGVGAVVLYSLFEEQVRRDAERDALLIAAGTESFAESLSYFPESDEPEPGARRYLSLLARSAAAVDIPVIGSLNGVTPGGWIDYARTMQDAGAAAIELNIYYLPGDPRISGRDVEQRHVDILDPGEGSGQHPGRREAEPVLQLDR